MHSNHATDPVHVLCQSVAVQGKAKTAMLVTANTPVSVVYFLQPAVAQH